MKSEFLEKKVWQGLVRNNRKDQEVLYREFYSYGMSICLRYSSTPEEAKEILHDGFMILFSDPRKFDPSQPFKPWFRKVLVNRCINLFKKNNKLLEKAGIERIPEQEDALPDALDQLQFEELLRMIQRLPSAYRAVFNLYVLDGYSHSEIAKMLEISVGTSKSNLSRAREKLRVMLKPHTHERKIYG